MRFEKSWVYLGISIALVFVLFPYFPLGLRTPMMAPFSWALSDTVVSHMNFFPGLQVIQKELFEHAQLLWSPARSMGMPLLANEIQSAPLFPLHLPFFFLPPEFFWPITVLIKIVLSVWLSLLLARRFFAFSLPASLVFAAGTALAMYVLRYINHPWHNSFIAFWAYFYLNLKYWNSSETPSPLTSLGLFLSIWGLASAGFPSSSAIFALLTMSFFLPVLMSSLKKNRKTFGKKLLWAALLHFAAIALVAPQLLSVLELLKETRADFRPEYGLYQIQDPFLFLGMLHRMWNGLPNHELVHVIRMIPLALMLIGVVEFFKARKTWKSWDWGILCVFLVALLKYFPLFPAFNKLIGNLPVFDRSHFTIYGFYFFLLPWAYFAALGTEKLRHGLSKKFLTSVFLICAALLIAAVYHARSKDVEVYPARFASLAFFLVSFGLYWKLGKQVFLTRWRYLLLVCFFGEFGFTHPSRFLSTDSSFYDSVMHDSSGWKNARSLISPLEKINFRTDEPMGLNVSEGFYTADVGATAILTDRQERLRRALFEVPWKGYLPIDSGRFENSFRLTSTKFFRKAPMNNIPASDWKRLQILEGGFIAVDTKALSRAYLAKNCIPTRNLEQSEAELKARAENSEIGFVILETEDPQYSNFCKNLTRKDWEAVDILVDSGNHMKLSKFHGPGILVLNDTFYPGWKATNSQEEDLLEIIPANLAFRALVLPEDRFYEINFDFEPQWLEASLWSVGFGGTFLFLLIFISGRQIFKRKPRP